MERPVSGLSRKHLNMIFSFLDSSSGMDPASAKAEVRSASCSVAECLSQNAIDHSHERKF